MLMSYKEAPAHSGYIDNTELCSRLPAVPSSLPFSPRKQLLPFCGNRRGGGVMTVFLDRRCRFVFLFVEHPLSLIVSVSIVGLIVTFAE